MSRSRKGAWIEIAGANIGRYTLHVAPARERGLKFHEAKITPRQMQSLPQGSVD